MVLLLSAILMVACSGSKNIQGKWKAQDPEGKTIDIVFKEKTVTLADESYDYTQNGVGTTNGLSYYIINIDDNGFKKTFTIAFPEKDKKTALMIAPDDTEEPLYGTLYYAMHKEKIPNYQAYVKKYMK